MTYNVYHTNDLRNAGFVAQSFPADFRHVATVEAEAVGHAWQLTNHIDSDWTENPEIRWHADRVRSSSVGDVIVDESGKQFVTAGVGFKEFTGSVVPPTY